MYQDLLLGSQCCFDIHGGVESWARGGAEVEWGKACCDNEYSPVKRPRQDLTKREMTKVLSHLKEIILKVTQHVFSA